VAHLVDVVHLCLARRRRLHAEGGHLHSGEPEALTHGIADLDIHVPVLTPLGLEDETALDEPAGDRHPDLALPVFRLRVGVVLQDVVMHLSNFNFNYHGSSLSGSRSLLY
jgi:hypothetical protein